MATNKKISDLTELTEASLASDDVLPIVDVSAGTTHKVRKDTLASALSGVSSITATSPIAADSATGAVTISTGTIPVASGGTGATSLTDGGVLLGSGTGAVTAMAVLTDGQMIVGDGSGDPVAESGATLRTSIGVGTGDSPQFTKVTVTGDTSAGDDAAMGYTAAEGLILTGQGSTNDVTIKNDADADVITIATGATNVDVVGDLTASTLNADGDTSASDNAAIGYTAAEGIIITGQGSTNDVTIKNDADADVITIATGATNVDIVGDITAATVNADGDTSAGDNATMGYTAAEGLILTGQGSTSDVTIKNDADATVFSIATGTTTGTFAGTVLAKTDTDTSNTGGVTLDFTANQNFVLTFTGNVTLDNPTTEQVGQSGIIVCIQDGTGSRTLSLGTDYETAGAAGITLSTAANAVDVIPYFVKAAASIQLGAVQKAFS